MPEHNDIRLLPRMRGRTRRLHLRACAGCGRRIAAAITRCPNCNTAPVYDHAHRRKRARLLPQAIGRRCPYCQQTMRADQPLDLDHTVDAITHATCNRRAGAATVNRGLAA